MILKKLVFLCLVTSNALIAQNNQFSLSGHTADFKDGTHLYFRDLVNGGDLDSAVVHNNRFLFTTDLPEPSLWVMIYTKDKANFTELWLEDKPMTFDAAAGGFKKAEVTGSRNQILATVMKEDVYADVVEISQEILKEREKEFIERHPKALVSAYVLNMATKRMTQNEVAVLFSTLSDEIQESSFGRRISNHLEKEIPKVGEKYLNYSIPNSKDKILEIADLRGKLTLLQFWSSSCPFSREMNRTILKKVYSQYKSSGLEIVNISLDTNKENWIQAIEEDNLYWPQLSNLQGWGGEAFNGYAVDSTPSNFLINEEGIIVAKNLKGEELEQKIKKELID